MHTADILNYEEDSKDQFEFELQQCSCQAQLGTDLLFAGSFDPDERDVSTTNLTVNLTVIDSNTNETAAAFSLSNRIVQMTNTLNIFNFSLSDHEVNFADLRTRNVSIVITLDGGIIPSSLAVPGKPLLLLH